MEPLNEEMSDSRAVPSLGSLLDSAWTELRAAVKDGSHGWHLAAVASVGLDGHPQCRTVVVRSADETSRQISFHTDVRAGKIAEFEHDPRVSVVFYDRAQRIQMRLMGTARVHEEDEVADAAWSRSSNSSRRCYLAPHAPSSTLEVFSPNLPEELLHRAPETTVSEQGRTNFAVVRVQVSELEWLHLHHDGHVRARFAWQDDGSLESNWIAP